MDMNSPEGIPLLIIVGENRDPIMTVSLNVSNLKDSLSFFTNVLGMKPLPFPLARPAGSQFEPPQPPNSIYLGYSPNTMGVLLQEAEKGKPLNIGNRLRYLKIVYDDSALPSDTPGKEEKASDSESLIPVTLRQIIARGGRSGEDENGVGTSVADGVLVRSPDGYPFVLQPLSAFSKTATK